MRKILVLALGASLLFTLAYANDQSGWSWEYKPVGGTYLIYSGELGDEKAPTQDDRKLAVEITGQPAKDIFDSMYPDFQPTCSGEKGDRDRRKGNLYCTFHPGSGYRCFIGLNLRNGKSIAGAIC
ncbi:MULTISPECIES: hypothetical protein [unclassified Janthinobacterium]|uniref:hypothetical protein n=1 Tax=unclassified Janthinobacterium TaxID=2610881 RepID=UPI00161D2AEA|nr:MULTISPECIES: hypothetical protein [unclassified Janthinobacterium]MBB5609068.1 hypothetical protein [Janthinobacterium sp. S3T4]MBB5614201.1 hypothetical protein [Janthinobacterium sp. S3M3]